MNSVAKLILDNNAHKCSVTINGKQQKVTIAPFNEMSITEANEIVRQINIILNAGYNFYQILNLIEISENLSALSKYHIKALNVAIKLLYQDELERYINTKRIENQGEPVRRPVSILNIGCTSAGKTLGNLYAIIPPKYVKNFLVLSTIKESTNFTIRNIINSSQKHLKDREEFEIEFRLKEEQRIKEDIQSLVLEALQEILDAIESEIKDNKNDDDVWEKALGAGCERLKINKDKTFDISHSVELTKESEVLGHILFTGIREYSTKSASYRERLTDGQIKKGILKDYRDNSFELTIDEIACVLNDIDEFKDLGKNIYKQLSSILCEFSNKYGISAEFDQTVCIRKRFDDLNAKELVSCIFGDKKQRNDRNFFSIDSLISNAKLYFQNDDINNGKEITIVDGLGINQGQIPKGKEKSIAYSRVHDAIQECNPDIIVYNTRIDTKDDYIIDVIKDLNDQGYKNRVYVIYGRVDTVLENYCDEEDEEISEISNEDLKKFEEYISSQYLNKELISLNNIETSKIFLCDKPCKLSKYSAKLFKKYTPGAILENIIKIYKETERKKQVDLKSSEIDKIIDTMDQCLVFNNTYIAFKNAIDDMVPMLYSRLRWNTLECGIKTLSYDGFSYASIAPSITLKKCFANYLNCEEIKAAIGEDYDNVLKELLMKWTSLAHLLMVTSYKSEFSILLSMRFNRELRTMSSLTLTDERKYILRNILNTCFEKNATSGPNAIRQLTKYVLTSIMY